MIFTGPHGASVQVFDIESNGLLDSISMAHCLVIKDNASGVARYNDQPHPVLRTGTLEEGVKRLQKATEDGEYICGHNVIKYDIPALKQLYPWFSPVMGKVLDTLVMVRLIYADIGDIDLGLIKPKKDGSPGRLPKHLYKSHSLEAWGYRTGIFKDEYQGDPCISDEKERKARKWERWNICMEDYCVQDVEATEAVFNKCMSKVEGPQFVPLKKQMDGFSVESIELEHAVAVIIAEQERYGICFNKEAATKLYSELVKEKLKIEEELKRTFMPRYFKEGKENTAGSSSEDMVDETLLGVQYAFTSKLKAYTEYKIQGIDKMDDEFTVALQYNF